MNRIPLIIILGSTGTGKTKLSIEIAKKFRGEIINADSMQVYKALDIITAKATKEEQNVVPHHLLDIINPPETFTVVDFRNKALPIIDNLLLQQKLPIVVGGTNYYIESLLWKILMDGDKKNTNEIGFRTEHELPSAELHILLQKLDPQMAKRLHPNNKRKILRSLEILQQKGKKHSDILHEQYASEDGSSFGGGLRYDNSIVFWLKCEQDALNTRLNDRVDAMIKEGLLDELFNFHDDFNKHRVLETETPEYTKGIFQSIGFKEFHDYLILENTAKDSEIGKKMLERGIDELKLVTRRYAKKQNRWVTNRFLGDNDRKTPPVYALDTTSLPNWAENVTLPSFDIINAFISNSECLYKQLDPVPSNGNPNSLDDTYSCNDCNRVFIGLFQYKSHMASHKHKRVLAKKHKSETVLQIGMEKGS